MVNSLVDSIALFGRHITRPKTLENNGLQAPLLALACQLCAGRFPHHICFDRSVLVSKKENPKGGTKMSLFDILIQVGGGLLLLVILAAIFSRISRAKRWNVDEVDFLFDIASLLAIFVIGAIVFMYFRFRWVVSKWPPTGQCRWRLNFSNRRGHVRW